MMQVQVGAHLNNSYEEQGDQHTSSWAIQKMNESEWKEWVKKYEQ